MSSENFPRLDLPENSRDALAANLLRCIKSPSLLFDTQARLIAAHPDLPPDSVAQWQATVRPQVWPGHNLPLGATLKVLSPAPAEVMRVELHEGGRPAILITPQPPTEARLKLLRQAHDLRVMLQSLTLGLSLQPDDGFDAQNHIEQTLGQIEDLMSSADDDVTIFDLSAEIRATLGLLRPLHAQQNVSIRLDAPNGVIVEGRKLILRKLIQNIVQNAAEQSRGGEVVIRLQANPTSGKTLLIKLAVSDQGAGLPAEALAQLQGKSSAAPTASGHGYGLGIIAQSVQQLKGNVTSEQGPPHKIVVRFRMSQAYGKDHDQAPALVGKKLLLVEDDPVVRDLVARILTSHGIELRMASTCASAINTLDQGFSPDLILLDYMLEGETAAYLLQQLQARDIQAPTLVLTGDDTKQTREVCLAAGATELLLKPISKNNLLRQLQRLLSLQAGAELNEATEIQTLTKPVLNPTITGELLEDMGPETTMSFLNRALHEAMTIAQTPAPLTYAALRLPIHSAIGACAMTGLDLVCDALTGLQQELKTNNDIPTSHRNLKNAITLTAHAIEIMYKK